MAKNKEPGRFKKVYSQGNAVTAGYMEVIVDTETGVNYVFCCEGYAGGLTPLLDREGKPVITTVSDLDE